MKNAQFYPDRSQVIICMIYLLAVLFSLPVFSQDPVADFTADQTTGCPGMVVIFTDQSVNAGKWTWTFEGGSPSSASTQGPHQVTYSNIGSFDVSLEVEGNNSSDKKVKTDYITVNDCSPTANFSVYPSSGCAPFTVTYTDQSVDATTWSWSFPSGNPSSAQTQGPHTVTYTGAGSYSATLVVANQYGQDTKIKNNVVTVYMCYDFGDAPAPYPTTLQQNGARHTYDASLFLGQGVDKEADGQPDSTATGDDTHGFNDEDGVEWLQDLVPNDTARVSVTASAGGFLKAWIDFNRDGDWEDEGEEVIDEQVGEGANELEIFVPEDAVEGNTYARFRYSDEIIPSFDGEVNGGEVEDMRVYLENFHYYDYGDLPEHELFTYDYHTMLENDGARHPVSESIFLGDFSGGSVPPDVEGDGQQNPAALGDDGSGIDDEEGVRIITPLSPGEMTKIEFSFHGNGTLHGWFDWNHNGEWDIPEEHVIDYTNTDGTIYETLSIDVPSDASPDYVFSRFRYSISPVASYYGRGEIGEVEDHRLTMYETTLDYGDAPESYGTTDPDGASHIMSSRIYLGEWNGFDVEPDGQPSPDALGDDNDGNDDENGVEFRTLTPGLPAGLDITSYADPVLEPHDKLHAWIDFDHDYVFQNTEKVMDGINLTNGTHLYIIDIPPDAVIGDTYARFRYCTYPPPDGPIGSGGEGEVEDYLVQIGGDLLDFGDAPPPFKTLLQEDGARHVIDSTVYLGSGISSEADGQPDSLAAGDDDDGVIFSDEAEMPGDTVEVTVTASTNGYLSIWYAPALTEADNISKIALSEDFPYKQIGIELTEGKNTVEIVAEESIFSPGIGYMRFRFGTQPIDNPGGIAPDGEVEDYLIVFNWKFMYEYGDAPEGAIAYPHTDTLGAFPTCENCAFHSDRCGDAGFIRHGYLGYPPNNYFGPAADIELHGNGGFCPDFYPDGYDRDETCDDGDAGLIGPTVYIIEGEDGSIRLTPTKTIEDSRLSTCQEMHWGEDIDIAYTVNSEEGAYINVLFDWNQDGCWKECYMGPCYAHDVFDHVVKNFHVPKGSGKLGDHDVDPFCSGDKHGYIWARFSITTEEVELEYPEHCPSHWDGSGIFSDGETEDYLLFFNRTDAKDFGDAPDSALAYPATSQTGYFPTCKKWLYLGLGHGYISHTQRFGGTYHEVYLGLPGSITTDEYNGNHGFCYCTGFHHFNKDIDNGLRKVKAYTITGPEGSETITEDYFNHPSPSAASLGMACQTARWGTNIDLAYTNNTSVLVYINVLIDWNQDGRWGGSVSCPESESPCEEHVLKNLKIDISGSQESIAGFMDSSEREFTIGPNSGYVWARFTITKEPVELPWEGNGNFGDGETEDYLLYITDYMPPIDYGDAWPPFKTLLIDDGARHIIDPDLYLGSGVSADADGQPDSLGNGDDDDGVVFLNDWVLGDTARFQITASKDGYIGIWYASLDHLGEIIVKEDFNQQYPGNARLSLFEGGNFEVKVETSKFPEPGDYWMRVRFSTDSSFSHFGLAPDGEVEDYPITIRALYDYGDAPDDATHHYETLYENNGARHPVDGSTYLANSEEPSVEIDGQPSLNAGADGGYREENGALFYTVFSPGETTTIQAYMRGAAYLHGWIDFNCDGDFHDSGEYFLQFDNTAIPYEESRLFDIVTPETAVPDTTYVRFRYCTDSIPFTPGGLGGFGEVEDFMFFIMEDFYDYGDAPDSYHTTGDDAARHPLNMVVVLGTQIDSEPTGVPGVNADGDDTDGSVNDEDGVTFSELNPGETTIITIHTSGPGYLFGWIDFNRDGDFDDSGENIISGDSRTWETTDYSIDVPVDAVPGDTYARFRYVFVDIGPPPAVNSYGTSLPGEVEDYKITIGPSTGIGNQSQVIPKEYALKQNFPNPFNPETSIGYDLPVRSRIKLTIFDALGKQIRKWEITEQPAGCHEIIWDARNENNRQVATGIYIYRIDATPVKSGDKPFQSIRKMIFLK